AAEMIAWLRRDLTGMSDPLLVERVRERDDDAAFDEIVRRHKNRIFSYICRMTKDAPDAEDLTQQVFIRAYQSMHRFRADAAVDLPDIERLSYEEVAEALGCPVGTVKSRLFNGRNVLRRKLAYYVEAD